MIPLRFLTCWNGYDRGQEVNFPHPGLAEELVARGVAVRMPDARPEPKTIAPPPPKGRARGTGTVHA